MDGSFLISFFNFPFFSFFFYFSPLSYDFPVGLFVLWALCSFTNIINQEGQAYCRVWTFVAAKPETHTCILLQKPSGSVTIINHRFSKLHSTWGRDTYTHTHDIIFEWATSSVLPFRHILRSCYHCPCYVKHAKNIKMVGTGLDRGEDTRRAN